MSLAKFRKLDERGVTFKSHLDGSRHELTPERSVEIQHLLDSNITMQLDECIGFPAPEEEAARAMRLSLRWAERCKSAFEERPGYGLLGSSRAAFGDASPGVGSGLTDIGFDGYAIGD